MKKNDYKFRLVYHLDTGEVKEKNFLAYEEMIGYLGFIVMISQQVQVLYKVGGEWSIVRKIDITRPTL